MKHCCEDKAPALRRLRALQSRTLKVVLTINVVMFLVETVAGWLAASTALLGDSLDMLGDALVYGFSLYVLDRSASWKARASAAKGAAMAILGVVVLGEAVSKVLVGRVPDAGTMGAVASLALAANATCLVLLLRHRSDDINMKSAWVCSRNDIVANVAVVGAGVLVAITGSFWPDVVVGVAIAALFLWSAYDVLRESYAQWRGAAEPAETTQPL